MLFVSKNPENLDPLVRDPFLETNSEFRQHPVDVSSKETRERKNVVIYFIFEPSFLSVFVQLYSGLLRVNVRHPNLNDSSFLSGATSPPFRATLKQEQRRLGDDQCLQVPLTHLSRIRV